MGYYATGGGSITFGRILTATEKEAVERAVDGILQYDFYNWNESGLPATVIDLWAYAKYYPDEVENMLWRLSQIAEIKDGCLDYRGEDEFLWRFVYRNGKWLEQEGKIVYDDPDVFGEVQWHREDVKNQMREFGIDPKAYPTLTDEILAKCQNNHHFTDAMIAAGWETINDYICDALEGHTIFVYDIIWETDDEPADLPSNVKMDWQHPDTTADYLSDTYGFLVKSFQWKLE